MKRQAGMRVPFLRMPSGFVDFSATFSTGASIVDILTCLIPGELEIKRQFESCLLALVQPSFFFSFAFFLPVNCRCGAKAVNGDKRFSTPGGS